MWGETQEKLGWADHPSGQTRAGAPLGVLTVSGRLWWDEVDSDYASQSHKGWRDRGGVTRRWLQLCPGLANTPGAHRGQS